MAARSARAEEPADLFDQAARLPELIVAFGLEAMNFVVQSKVEETVRQWIGRADLDPDDPNGEAVLAEALMFALELAAFTPGLSGATAVDRLLRQHRNASPDESAALAALKQASFRLLRIKSIGRDGVALVEDLATGKALSMRDPRQLLFATRNEKLFGPRTANSGLLNDDLFKIARRDKSFIMRKDSLIRDSR